MYKKNGSVEGVSVKPLNMIYWGRAGLGMVIGVLCAVYLFFSATSELTNIYTLLTGVSFALLFYVATYYIIKLKFFGAVEKKSKLITHGIGIYFFAWVVSWILAVSLLLPSVSVSIYVGGELAEGRTFWVAAHSAGGGVVQNVTTASGSFRMALLAPGNYVFQLGGNFENETVEGQNQESVLGWLQSSSVVFNVTQSP